MATYKELDHGQSGPLEINYNDNNDLSNTWTFKHCGYNATDSYFFIEMPYGEMRPRLGFQRANPQTSSKLIAISVDTEQIKKENLVWHISQVNKQ